MVKITKIRITILSLLGILILPNPITMPGRPIIIIPINLTMDNYTKYTGYKVLKTKKYLLKKRK